MKICELLLPMLLLLPIAAQARPIRLDAFSLKDPIARDMFLALEREANGFIDFGFNVNMRGISVTITFADTEQAIDISSLGLDYIPVDFMQYGSSNGGYLYPSDKPSWTATQIKVKSTKASCTATVVPFPAH